MLARSEPPRPKGLQPEAENPAQPKLAGMSAFWSVNAGGLQSVITDRSTKVMALLPLLCNLQVSSTLATIAMRARMRMSFGPHGWHLVAIARLTSEQALPVLRTGAIRGYCAEAILDRMFFAPGSLMILITCISTVLSQALTAKLLQLCGCGSSQRLNTNRRSQCCA